jgi:predicted AAA+ superfamily ATPase
MVIIRNYREKLNHLLASYPVVFVLGPRQCGKTTFVRNQLPGYEYLDLERPSDEAKVRTEPELFFENRKRPLILDEAQRAPELFPILRSLVDQNKKKGQYVILGSASLDLIKGISESLAGRIGFLDMTTFTLEEVYGRVPDSFRAHWLKGGFPDAFLTQESQLNFDWFENYTRSLIERDLPALGVELDPVQFRRLWTMLVLSHGDILNMNKLASSMGISPHTVDRYIGILERSFLLRRLPPYFRNLKKRLVKSPKLYVRDSGMLHYFLRLLSFEDLSVSPHRGASFEGYALEQIILAAKLKTPHVETSYFRTADGLEIDLLLSEGETLFPIEIKAKLSPGKSDIENLLKARKILEFRKAVVLCLGKERYPLAEGIECLGIEAWAETGFAPFWTAKAEKPVKFPLD